MIEANLQADDDLFSRIGSRKIDAEMSKAINLVNQIQKKTVKKLDEAQFKKEHNKALENLKKNVKGFTETYKKLNLSDSSAFSVFITDIFVNTARDQNAKTGGARVSSCLLLERFGSLLNQLSGV